MAIQPIDLQALLAQLDSVAKTQLAQKEGPALQQSLQGAQLQRKASEKENSVNEVRNAGDEGPEKVSDEGRRGLGDGRRDGENSGRAASGGNDEEGPPVFRDPTLGRNVDINF